MTGKSCIRPGSAYNRASKAAEYKNRFADSGSGRAAVIVREQLRLGYSDGQEEEQFAKAAEGTAFVRAFQQTFAGREDLYGREEFNNRRKRCVETVPEPLTVEVLRGHLRGECTLATYPQRSNQTVRYLVVDVDISKRNLLQEGSEGALEKYLPQAAEAAAEMLRLLKHLGLKGYPEYSGFRGYHIWIFFTEWIPTRYVNMLTDILDAKREPLPADVTVEYFPNKSRLKNGSVGQALKLPYGIHIQTGKRSMLLTEDFEEIAPDAGLLADIARFSLQAVKRIIGANTQPRELLTEKKINADLSGFGELPDSVRVVLVNCSLMRYLCQKARTTGYLTHFERLSVLYVFGHIGEQGQTFVHTVMQFTLNYKYHVTERFIQKLPAKPVSCIKLRDQYKQITAEFGCSCNFHRTKNCYPSPVLHAIESSEDLEEHVTVPTSRTVSRAKEKEIAEELNVHKQVQELAARIVEMKKQKRGIDKVIRKTEAELERIYDQEGCDCMEVEMGLLVRRRMLEGYEWLIEI